MKIELALDLNYIPEAFAAIMETVDKNHENEKENESVLSSFQ